MLSEKKSQLYHTTGKSKNYNNMKEGETSKDHSKVDKIIDEYDAEKGSLVSILHDIQVEFNYLTPESLMHVSKRMNIPLMQVFQVAMFYKEFNVWPTKFSAQEEITSNKNSREEYLSKFNEQEVCK